MKALFIAISLLIANFSYGQTQTATDSITIKQTILGGYIIKQGDKRLGLSQLAEILKTNEQAYREIKAAQSTNGLRMVLGFPGGFLVGWTLGSAMGGDEPDMKLAGIGLGLMALSFPFSYRFNMQINQAIATYNKGLAAQSVH